MKTTRAFLLSFIILVIISLVVLPPVSVVVAESQSPGSPKQSVTTSNPDQIKPIFLPLISHQIGSIYYVAPYGNDAYPGTYSQPWQTLGKASDTLHPGDTVYVRTGVYYESVRFATSGSSKYPIKILAFPQDNPIIDGTGTIPGDGSALLSLKGDYIYASGFEVRNSAYDGIQALGNHDIVSHMYVHHSQKKGIFINQGIIRSWNITWCGGILQQMNMD